MKKFLALILCMAFVLTSTLYRVGATRLLVDPKQDGGQTEWIRFNTYFWYTQHPNQTFDVVSTNGTQGVVMVYRDFENVWSVCTIDSNVTIQAEANVEAQAIFLFDRDTGDLFAAMDSQYLYFTGGAYDNIYEENYEVDFDPGDDFPVGYVNEIPPVIIEGASWLESLIGSISSILNLDIFPNFKLSYFLFVPLVLGVIFIILKFVK